MYRIPASLDSDIDYTESLIEKYKNGEISAQQLKSNRVPMGIYEQRKNNHYMLRVRCAGGLITPEQLATVAHVGKQVSTSHLHITTRSEIQIHNVDLADAIPSLRKLEKKGLSTAGGGGNTVRNMTVNEMSGLTADEAFDVYPYVEELTSRLIAEKDSYTMPRKYKVAFDYNIKDADTSYVADLGLQAQIKDGVRGFRVLIAGSTTSSPHTGWEVFDFLPERDLYRAAKALKNWFNKYGNRRNRHRARMRFVFYKYGEEEAKRLYYEEFEALRKDKSLDFEAPALPLEHHRPDFAPESDDSEEFLTWKRRYAGKQTAPETKGENLWYAYIPIEHGNQRPEFFAGTATFTGAFGNDVIRFTKKEQLQLRNIPEEYLPNVYHFFRRQGIYQVDYPKVVTNLTSCTGADTCRLGICLPKPALEAIANRLLKSDIELDRLGSIELKMNGCTNICANATWADLGFSGRIGRVGDDPYPAYTVWLPTKGPHEIDTQQGYVPARHLPAFVEDYLRDVAEQQDNYTDYYDYVARRGKDVIAELIKKHKGVKPFAEEPEAYYDWDEDEKFSLIKYGQAECSAGLFDIIELDQDTIREKRKLLETAPETDVEKILHDIVFSENRMLLVTRGIDPRTDDDVYNGFIHQFIEAGIVPERFRVLTERARNNESLNEYRSLIFELADLLNDLYKNMDDSLQFKVPVNKDNKPDAAATTDSASAKDTASSKDGEAAAKDDTAKGSNNTAQKDDSEAKEEEKEASPAEDEIKVDVFKDFRGVACPMNFVKTKIALTPMKSGDVLEILLDDGEPIHNVPGSVKNEGHTVLKTEKVDNYWKVVIRKK